jgi:hypothetical protein
LRFASGNKEVDEVIANTYSKDVQLAKVHPMGLCGFDFNFPPEIDVTTHKNLEIYIDVQEKPFVKLPTTDLRQAATQAIPPILCT